MNKDTDLDFILTSLRNNTCVVNFTKKNGEERVMRCTTDADKIPDADVPQNGIVLTSEKHSAVKCFDLEKMAWRSFNVENVTAFHLVEEANDF